MRDFVDKILAPLAVAAITAVTILLFQFNGRLTRIEAKLELLAPARTAALDAPENSLTPAATWTLAFTTGH